MKKFTVMIIAALMIAGLSACGTPDQEQPEEQVDYEIALVTDSGLLMDGGYSEIAWNAISEFGASEGISHKYYKAAEASSDAYKTAIDTAVSKGAKVIVADGNSFENIVYEAQNQYPDVKFILIDAEPADAETGEGDIGENTMSIMFASEEAGYLAGYCAVEEGMTHLGFMGGSRTPVIMDYGYGFLQGADRAARERGAAVTVDYSYCASDEERESVLEKASALYSSGEEVIFACGKNVEQPVIEAAELTGRKVIAYETDKSQMSDTVMTSAVKDIGTAIENALEMYLDDEFPGGEVIYYNASNDGIWLEMENGRFENLDESQYESVYEQLKDGEITVKKYDSGDIQSLELTNLTINEGQ